MSTFDAYKRQAVQLERQLEDQIALFQQMTQKKHAAAHTLGAAQDVETGSHVDFETTIPRLLSDLDRLVATQLYQAAATPPQRAVASRYQAVCADLRTDYDKNLRVYKRATERAELLGASRGGNAPQSGGEMDSLLRERSHIGNSLSATNAVLGQAEAVQADLRAQGRSLRAAGALLGSLTSNIPGLNRLVDNIRRRRSRDDVVVAGTIAFCILFTLWYLFG